MDASEALTMWVDAGELDPAVADRLRRSLDAHDEPVRANRVIAVLVSIGAVLIGGGLLLFIASQWGQSSPALRLVLLFGIYGVIVAAAAVAAWQNLGITARGLWFLSSIAAGANIFLIGQVFNLPLAFWQGTLLWLLATLAMGWAAPSSAQGWLAVPLGVLTLGWLTTPSGVVFGEQMAFLFHSASIRPILPIIGLGLIAVGLLVSDTGSQWLQRPAQAIGALLVAVPLTVSTFHPDAFAWLFQIDLKPFHLVVVLAAVALVGLVWRRESTSPLILAFVVVALLLVALLPQVSDSRFSFDTDTVSWLAPTFQDSALLFFLYSAVIFAIGLATILAGERFAIRGLVNLGFGMVSVLVFALYVGRIAGELPTSLAVILGGLILVGGAIFMERKRREVTAAVELTGAS